jgi:hypothetical protein
MFAAMKSIQVVARVTKEYMHEVDPYRDKVKEYVEKIRKQEWLDWMTHSVAEYRQNGWAVWEECLDPASQTMYYVNDQTGETLWEPPLDNSPYIPYVPPTPAERKKMEMSKYLEQVKDNIVRIEQKQREEEEAQELKLTKAKLKAFEDGDVTAFAEVKETTTAQTWMQKEEVDAWALWANWMKEQWTLTPTPWFEIPHLDSGEHHYINRETHEVRTAPPSNGVYYKPFEPPASGATGVLDAQLDAKTLALMATIKEVQDNKEKAELLAMYREKFDHSERVAWEAREVATTAYDVQEQW